MRCKPPAFLLTIIFLCLTAGAFAQTITFSGKKASINQALEAIKKQTNFAVVFNPAHLSGTTPITIEVRDMPLETFLKTIFEKQPLAYSLVKNTIIVYQREVPELSQSASSSVSGTVLNARGERMDGASVIVQRSKDGTMANARGEFVIKGIQVTDTLVITQIGYNAKKVSVLLPPGESVLKIVLADATNQLDEVVMRAYGTTSERLSTGNISRVTAKEIEKQPVMNPLLALQGRVPGLNITQINGYASSPVRVELRGRTALNSAFSTEPLYVVDGVPIVTLNLRLLGQVSMGGTSYQGPATAGGNIAQLVGTTTAGQSPLFSINPKDIESMEVLKDADATALYGSRGANGVILITLKKGKTGPVQFSFNAEQGINAITCYWKMMNTSQYLQVRREAFKNDGIMPTPLNAPDLFLWDTTRNVDWQRELYGGIGKNTSVGVGLSGGNAQTTFSLRANYNRITDITTVSGATQRLTIASNFAYKSQDQRFSLDFSNTYAYAPINVVGVASSGNPFELPPNAPAIFDKKGNLNWSEWNAGGIETGRLFKFGALKQTNKQNSNILNSSLDLGYTFFKGLKFTTRFGYTNSEHRNEFYQPSTSFNPLEYPMGMSSLGNNSSATWMIEPLATYKSIIGKSNLSLLLGGTLLSTFSQASSVTGIGYTEDDLLGSLMNAPYTFNLSSKSYSKQMGVYAQINYNFTDKIIITLSGRRDGNSNFGPKKRFGNFGSIGAAWIVSEEKWLQELLPSFFSFLKFQGSYGSTGSANVGEYRYTSQWASSKNNSTPLPAYNGVSPLVNMHAVNPDYRWQINRKLYAGISLGFWDDRLQVNAGYYRDRSGNQLLELPMSVFTGFDKVVGNLNALVENSGLEGSIRAVILQNKKFKWSAGFNISANRNKLISFPDLANSPYATYYRVGAPTNLENAFHYTGVDPLTGQYSFYDYNKDGRPSINYEIAPGTLNDDRNVIINLSPKYRGGFNTQLEYRNWAVGLHFEFVNQLSPNAFTSLGIGSMRNLPAQVMGNYWQQPGDQTIYSKPSVTQAHTGNLFFQKSDKAFDDGSYLRMNNLSFAYSLPDKLVKKMGSKGCRLSVNGNNIFVITKYKGLDPMVPWGSMPVPRTIVANISFIF